jgi:lantibiotic modifying enzyme
MTKIAIDDIVTHLDLTTAPEEIAALPFGEAVWPWMQAARKQLLQAVPHIHSLMSRRAYLSLEKSLAIRLSAISSHSLLLELGIKKLEGVLEGGNPRERFLDFIKQLACDKQALSSFFAEYNVLASAIGSILKFWVDQSAAFVKRFENDRKVLSEEFNGGKALGKIASLSLNAGDVHNQGSAVMIVGFA